MSLLRKTLLFLLLAAIPVALTGVWVFDALVNRVIRHEVDEQLSSDLKYIQHQLQTAQTPLNRGQYFVGQPAHLVAAVGAQRTPFGLY